MWFSREEKGGNSSIVLKWGITAAIIVGVIGTCCCLALALVLYRRQTKNSRAHARNLPTGKECDDETPQEKPGLHEILPHLALEPPNPSQKWEPSARSIMSHCSTRKLRIKLERSESHVQ